MEAPKRATKLCVCSDLVFVLSHDLTNAWLPALPMTSGGRPSCSWAGNPRCHSSCLSPLVVPLVLRRVSLSFLLNLSKSSTHSVQARSGDSHELCSLRLQDKSSTFAGPMDVVRQIVKKDGVLGLYAGMEATFWRYDTSFRTLSLCSICYRHFWWNGGYFGCIFQVRTLLPKAEVSSIRVCS